MEKSPETQQSLTHSFENKVKNSPRFFKDSVGILRE